MIPDHFSKTTKQRFPYGNQYDIFHRLAAVVLWRREQTLRSVLWVAKFGRQLRSSTLFRRSFRLSESECEARASSSSPLVARGMGEKFLWAVLRPGGTALF